MFEYHPWDTSARCRQIERNNGFVDLRINKSVSPLEPQRKASYLMLGLFYLVVGRVKVATNRLYTRDRHGYSTGSCRTQERQETA